MTWTRRDRRAGEPRQSSTGITDVAPADKNRGDDTITGGSGIPMVRVKSSEIMRRSSQPAHQPFCADD